MTDQPVTPYARGGLIRPGVAPIELTPCAQEWSPRYSAPGTIRGRKWEVHPEGPNVKLYVGRPNGDRMAVLLAGEDVRALVEALTVTADNLTSEDR